MEKPANSDSPSKVTMTDIGPKEIQQRSAKAIGHIRLTENTLKLITENLIPAGDVLTLAKVAGINAAKATSGLIPLCHNITLDHVNVTLFPDETGIVAESEVKCTDRSGTEMEALTSVSVALITVYDMCREVDNMMALDRIMVTEQTKK